MTRQELSESIRRLAGVSPFKGIPDAVLDAIIEDLREAAAENSNLRKPDFEKIVGRYVEQVGRYKEAGEDFSLINSVLVAIQNTKPPRR